MPRGGGRFDDRGGRERGDRGDRGSSGGRRDDYDSAELGSQASKFKGLFSEKDWACRLCGNINWARRFACNQCNSPKPGSGKDASREGFGGGYKDREDIVEYKESRFNDDDEWDEFGRRKKKKGDSETTTIKSDQKGKGGSTEPKNTREDEEDEDEEGDSGEWDAWADIIGDDKGAKDLKSGGRIDDQKIVAVVGNGTEGAVAVKIGETDAEAVVVPQMRDEQVVNVTRIEIAFAEGAEAPQLSVQVREVCIMYYSKKVPTAAQAGLAGGIAPGSPALGVVGIPGRTGISTQSTATPPMDPFSGFGAFSTTTTTTAPALASQPKIGNSPDDLFGGLTIAPTRCGNRLILSRSKCTDNCCSSCNKLGHKTTRSMKCANYIGIGKNFKLYDPRTIHFKCIFGTLALGQEQHCRGGKWQQE
ncbi:hypothetical protein BJ742DRAFT_864402 [Cladochytrium replicatum]|nr:hypothetical protein BJ742DRAFT_864402 [Cladochytrium replicatum]